MWIGAVADAISMKSMKSMLEAQLQDAQEQKIHEDQQKLGQEFLVTRTIGNAEVCANLEDWEPSICAEYEHLINQTRTSRTCQAMWLAN